MGDYPGYKPKHYDNKGGHIEKHLRKIDEKFGEIDGSQTALDTKADKSFIRTDDTVGTIFINSTSEHTKGLTAFTGMIGIRINNLYSAVNMNGRMEVIISEPFVDDRTFIISGHWNHTNTVWDSATAIELTKSATPMTVSFARNTTTSEVWILFGGLDTVRANTRVSIINVVSSYVPALNLNFDILPVTSLTNIDVIYTITDTGLGNIVGQATPPIKQGNKIYPEQPYSVYYAWLDVPITTETRTMLMPYRFTNMTVSAAVIHFELMGTFDISLNPSIASIQLRIREYNAGDVGAVVHDLGTYTPTAVLSEVEFWETIPPAEKEFSLDATLDGYYWIESILRMSDTGQGESTIVAYTFHIPPIEPQDRWMNLVPLYISLGEEYNLDQLHSYLYQGELATTAIDSSMLSPYTMNIDPIFSPIFPFIYFKE